MLNLIFKIGICTGLILWSHFAMSAADSWTKSSSTKVQTQGLKISDGESCETLEAQWTKKSFHLKLRCGTYYFSSLYPLNTKTSSVRVSQTKSILVLTGFDYKSYKIQTQIDTFHSLRIPFVNEVIRVEKFAEGHLSVYRETFETDDLGRIVSTSSMQVIALEAKVAKDVVALDLKKRKSQISKRN